MDKRIEILLPHLAICVWGDSDTEEILKDIVMCQRYNLSAISCTDVGLRVLGNITDTARVFAFVESPEKLAKISARENISAQFFVKIDDIENIPHAGGLYMTVAMKLAQIEHLDWNRIFPAFNRSHASGFLFIDDSGKYLQRFYDFLNLVPQRDLDVGYCAGTNDIEAVESAYRLIKKIRPEFLYRFKLFVTRDFFNNIDKDIKSV